MPNVIKYTTGTTPDGCLRKGDMSIGNNTVDYGPSFYNGVEPPVGGYTIYLNKATGGPSIYVANNDAELITLTNHIAQTSYTTVEECLTYFSGQNDKLCVDKDYEGIVTNGLILNLDAGIVASYPKTGTTWYDLSGGGYHANLYNGVGYGLTAGVPSLICDGVSDWIGNTTLPGGHSDFTLELMFYHNGIDQRPSYGVVSMGSNGNYGPMHYCHTSCTGGHYFPGSPSGDYPGYNVGWNNLQ